jgi:coenzyme F420-0:L-glutamate ligase/coenzyme F420-1:gamma-L-glutamate ligase
MTSHLSFTALQGIAHIVPGDDLSCQLAPALAAEGTRAVTGDVLIVAQKIVSKAEGRLVDLRTVTPGARAMELAGLTAKDPRLVELILSESTDVIRAKRDVLIVRHRLGHVMANAGIDRSNVESGPGREQVLLLPLDPDASARALRTALAGRLGIELGVIVSDSFGRPWRNGVTNVALGVAGLPALIDRRGEQDMYGRRLEVTQVAFADAIATAAGLAMGEGAEATPAVLARGLRWSAPPGASRDLLRPLDEDLFR